MELDVSKPLTNSAQSPWKSDTSLIAYHLSACKVLLRRDIYVYYSVLLYYIWHSKILCSVLSHAKLDNEIESPDVLCYAISAI